MSATKIRFKWYFTFQVVIIILFLDGCAKETPYENLKPVVNVSQVADGLQVNLTGSASDPDGTVAIVTINWGDNMYTALGAGEFAGFNISHLYGSPGDYNIRITAQDNAADSATQTVVFPANFKETSLSGIKSTMFKAGESEFLILTVNLHTYQETRQNEKLQMVADVIGEMNIDFVAFQECAQNKSSAIAEGIIRVDNMARIISSRILDKYGVSYNFAWNWAHYGWSVWEEGVAVLSRYPVIQSEDRYISSDKSTANITSRKVIYASVQSPAGIFNIFSAHTHWRTSTTDTEQNKQISNIKSMVSEKEAVTPLAISLVCGDFNGNPTSDYPWSEGYNTMMQNGVYSDTFLEVYPDANQKPALAAYYTVGGTLPGRIDYIYLKKNPRIQVVDSQIIFTAGAVGVVSDHFGVLTKLRIVN
jgi:maltose 6'-phosphate phosphatase